jgi:uncharacterized heparinase superfamily protein
VAWTVSSWRVSDAAEAAPATGIGERAVLGRLGNQAQRLGRRVTDTALTLPVVRWTWRSLADDGFGGELPEFRPSDRDAVREMMAGRYLLASKLIDTGGLSPFGHDTDHPDWWKNLQGFSWLRHFRDVRDSGERHFARMLVLDWIGREGQFDRQSWAPDLTATRVLNWLRHLPLLLEDASSGEAATIRRVLGTQIQSLKLRCRFTPDPVDRLLAAIALLGAAYCDANDKADVPRRLDRLNRLLAEQLDADGMHVSRKPRLQLQLLIDLLSVRRAPGAIKSEAANELGAQIDRMHEALDAMTLSSGEPGYFNGSGQVPHDVLVAIQSNGPGRRRRSTLIGGYGVLRDGLAVLIADSGLRPPPGFDTDFHHSALAMEFSFGSELIVGNCGPAPADMPDSRNLFRQGVAHSGPTMDGEDAPALVVPLMTLEAADHLLTLTTKGYARRFGVEIERRITLLSGGTTLVGQDRMVGTGTPSGTISVRFHLAPNVVLRRNPGDELVRLVTPKGASWSFLWEGAQFREEESVRQSARIGFHRTRQLVLEAPAQANAEVAWIFTLEQN